MPFIPRLKSLGFSGIAYKYVVLKERLILLFMLGMMIAVTISTLLCLKILGKEFWADIHTG
jgi:hypothetical protein